MTVYASVETPVSNSPRGVPLVVMKWTRPCADRLQEATMSARSVNPFKFITFQLGSDKVRSAQARFLIAPVEHRPCPFEGIRLNTFGPSPWPDSTTKRSFAFLQLHRSPPVDSLRVRWVPLLQSFQRLGAFACSPAA